MFRISYQFNKCYYLLSAIYPDQTSHPSCVPYTLPKPNYLFSANISCASLFSCPYSSCLFFLGEPLLYFLLKLHPTCQVPFKRLFQKAFTELSCYPSPLNSRCTLHDQINLVVLYFCTCPYFSYQITESQIIK